MGIQINEEAEAEGNRASAGASAGPLIRTKILPYDVAMDLASDGTGHDLARAS
jgi:hypothetical protein